MAFFSLNQSAIRENKSGTCLDERRKHVNDFPRLISRKTVSFSVGKKYDLIPSLLASVRMSPCVVSPLGNLQNHESLKWCPLVNYIRTLFSN